MILLFNVFFKLDSINGLLKVALDATVNVDIGLKIDRYSLAKNI